MRSLRPARRRASIMLAVGLLATSMPLAPAAADHAPSVRLIRSRGSVTVRLFRDRAPLDLGVWVASAGGDFEIHVGRDAYEDPLSASQVDSATKAPLRSIPAEDLNGWEGLDDFLRINVRNPAGRTVASKRLDFCPNSYARERVDDSGEAIPTYPAQECSSYFPFTKGTVWGIDRGWATSTFADYSYGASYVSLKPGDYTATMRVTQHFVDLFEVAPGDEKVTVDLQVLEQRRSGGGAHRDFSAASGSSRGEELAAAEDVPTVLNPDPATLPDLAALPAWGIRVRNGKRDYLSFAATPWNAGPSALVVEGFRGAQEDQMEAFQYFYSNGTAVGRAPVGTFDYDTRNGHHHWHFLQFARYRLLVADDTSEVVRSRKQSFCIAPTDAVDLTVPGAFYNPWELGFGSTCGQPSSIWVREVLQPGWGDTYYQSVAGQAFDITNVPNGDYLLETSVNPAGQLYDVDASNDVELRMVTLSGRPDRRRVTVSPWHGIEK
ncbi:MAG: lysyl oxidase family protein [Actinomycetota bacterium]|nr:lysyl oxidase family protein [Actinomycetota bacterium]